MESQAVVEAYFKNSKKPITAENNVVKMAKSLVARMAKGFTAPRAAKAPKSSKFVVPMCVGITGLKHALRNALACWLGSE